MPGFSPVEPSVALGGSLFQRCVGSSHQSARFTHRLVAFAKIRHVNPHRPKRNQRNQRNVTFLRSHAKPVQYQLCWRCPAHPQIGAGVTTNQQTIPKYTKHLLFECSISVSLREILPGNLGFPNHKIKRKSYSINFEANSGIF